MKWIILVQIIAYLYEQWNFFHIRKWEKMENEYIDRWDQVAYESAQSPD